VFERQKCAPGHKKAKECLIIVLQTCIWTELVVGRI
jgi:hypothetical protein